jgi:hypothetical protein
MSLYKNVTLCFALTLPCTVSAQTVEPSPGISQPILHDFVPDSRRLELVTGEELKAQYSAQTIAGIYDVTRHSDQRYVETLSTNGKISYRERAFQSEGKWFVRGDRLCFIYDEQPGREHCFYEFRYGDCIISYSDTNPVVAGKPLLTRDWSSVQKFVDSDFRWPDVPADEADAFACFLSFV